VWTVYGFYINNLKVVIPNVLGIACSIVQIAVWYYFYSYNKNKTQVNDAFIDKENAEVGGSDTEAPNAPTKHKEEIV
jgi:hypothetical protein